jgi:D-alanine-D-alanine ligase
MTSNDKPRVAVVFGGRSGEHAISCVTAAGVLGAIDRSVYDVVAIGITPTGRWVAVDADPASWQIQGTELPQVTETSGGTVVLPPHGGATELFVLELAKLPESLGRIDVVFPLLHGPFGEDGTLQGMLELADTRYVGSGVLASAVGMDKAYMKIAFAAAGIEIGPYVTFRLGEFRADPQALTNQIAPLGLPLFVKPARAGSSLGITKVHRLEDLAEAVEAAGKHDPKIVVEAAINGREIECAVLGSLDGPPRTAPPGEIVVTNKAYEFYDFEAKYLDEASVELTCPADLPESVTASVQDLAARVFTALDCEGLARVDFFVDGDRVIVNEINTMPGFTPFSMYPRMWAAAGMTYPELVDELIRLALHRPTGLR